ncbi:MAG: signal peptide peptidase SppA [Nitrospirota bacterium]|nr:signal peptide peptidase SppA [Nitrospirota bacterium]
MVRSGFVLLALWNISFNWPINAHGKAGIISWRECSKKFVISPAQTQWRQDPLFHGQGRRPFGARSVHCVREHGKRARTPLAAFFNIPLLALLTLTGCVSQGLFPKIGPLEETVVSGKGGDKVLLMDISGVLTSSRPSGFIDQFIDRPSLPARIKEELDKAADDSNVKAIVLRINTPGGTVAASDTLHHEIQAFKDKHNIPIVASIMDLGTSGGYYVAMASDTVVAHPSAVTGSLGVIMLTMNASGLLEKVGVEAVAVKSGLHKDMGSPFRAMTAKDRAIFQSVIDSFYRQFLNVIEKGRPKLSPKTIQQLADGRIYSAQQAKEHKLIDVVGYLDDAIDVAKRAAKISDAKVVRYHRQGGYHPNIYAQMGGGSPGIMFPSLDPISLATFLGGATPAFLYLWLP